jgi:phosphate transport system permease protein
MKRRLLWKIEEWIMQALMIGALALLLGILLLILVTVVGKGLPALSLEMLTQPPKGGYYTGAGGGILNAILGSLCLALGATFIASLFGLPVALYLQVYAGHSRLAEVMRLALDVLWASLLLSTALLHDVMLLLGLRASLLGESSRYPC